MTRDERRSHHLTRARHRTLVRNWPHDGRALLRSFLYVPGDRADRVAKALDAGADAILIDLEDAVALLRQGGGSPGGGRQPAQPIRRGPRGVGPHQLRRDGPARRRRPGDASLRTWAGWSWPSVTIWTGSTRSASTMPVLGPAFSPDRVGPRPAAARCPVCPPPGDAVPPGRDRPARRAGRPRRGRDRQLLGHAHAELLYASAAAGILPPIGGVYTALRDLDGLAADSVRLAQLGFAGTTGLPPLPGAGDQRGLPSLGR